MKHRLDELYGASNPYDDEISKLLKEGAYDKLMNKQIQNYNLKSNAEKYYQNSLANQGLQGSGYGSSAMTGIQNKAIDIYNQNEKDYFNELAQIDKDAITRAENEATELDNQLVTFIQNDINTNNGANIDQFLINYGYKDVNGFTDKWNNLDPNRKAYIESVIASKPAENVNAGVQFDFSDKDSSMSFYDKNGTSTSGKIKDKFDNETNYLISNIQLGKIPNDSHIKLTNVMGDYIYLYYKNGQFFYQTQDQYDNSKNKFSITYDLKNKKGDLRKE